MDGTGGRRWAAGLAALVLATALGGCAASDDEASAPPDRPGEIWHRVTLCTSVGPASIDMPGPVSIDGPRDLAHLRPPAEGTFAVSYGSTDDRRYDAFVIDDVAHLGSDGCLRRPRRAGAAER